MTELFDGVDDRFYHSRVSAGAIDPGCQTRKVLYKLYHVLNHFNLFSGYVADAAHDGQPRRQNFLNNHMTEENSR